MKSKIIYAELLFVLATAYSCHTPYHLVNVQKERILVDKRYDKNPDYHAATLMLPYKQKVDSLMGPVLGSVDSYMNSHRPESPLTDLFCDILVWGGQRFNEKPDFSVYNVGGIRAALAKGTVTVGDVLDCAPFENKICFLTLKGSDVLQLFKEIAARGGEGVSKSVSLKISSDSILLSAKINGASIKENSVYRVATLDYLAQGNDGLATFSKGTNIVSPQNEENNVRYVIMDYFRNQTLLGKVISNPIDSSNPRIAIEK